MNPVEWEKMCLIDEARNSFAIPTIQKYIDKVSPACIIDVGCGTGYITRRLLENGYGVYSDWFLIDHNSLVLKYARNLLSNLKNIQFLEFDIQLISSEYFINKKSIFAFICYSLLEILDLETFINSLNKILAVNEAFVGVIYPDVIEDIENASSKDKEILTKYRNGRCEINKEYNNSRGNIIFYAHRIENIIQIFFNYNFILIDFQSYLTLDGKRHFSLLFQRI